MNEVVFFLTSCVWGIQTRHILIIYMLKNVQNFSKIGDHLQKLYYKLSKKIVILMVGCKKKIQKKYFLGILICKSGS